MFKKSPLFTVMVPAYNSEKYIERCILSVLQQSYDNWEMIIIDDGSSDNTSFITDAYAKKDSRIFVIHRENKGYIYTVNELLLKSNGKYVFSLDSDNWVKNNNLFFEMSVLIDKLEPDIIQTSYSLINEGETTPYEVVPILEKPYYANNWSKIVSGIQSGKIYYLSHGGKAIKRILIDNAILFSGDPTGSDTRFFCSVLSRSSSVYCFSNQYTFVELRQSSLSHVKKDSCYYLRWIEEDVKLLDIHYERYKKGDRLFPHLSFFIEIYNNYIISKDINYFLAKKYGKQIWNYRFLFFGICSRFKLYFICKRQRLYRLLKHIK